MSLIDIFVERAEEVWRKYETDGVPVSGLHQPDLDELQQWGNDVEAALEILDGRIAIYNNLAQVEITVVDAGEQVIRTAGYYAAGDGGDAMYKRVVSEPAHAGKVQSADGAWWEIAATIGDVKQFGAKGDGTTSDAAAINNAAAFAETFTNGSSIGVLYFPKTQASYYLGSTSISVSKSLCIKGDGEGASRIFSDQNIPYLLLDATANDMYDGKIFGLGFLTGNGGTRTAEAAIKLIGSHVVAYWTVKDLECIGVYRFFDWSAFTGAGAGWHTFDNCKSRNNGGLVTNNWMFLGAGAQGSFEVTNCVISASATGISAGDGVVNVGDFLFEDNEFNSCAVAIDLEGGPSYGTNVQINGCAFDAGVIVSLSLLGMGNVNMPLGNNFGGATDIVVANSIGAGTTQGCSIHIERYESLVVNITTDQNDFNPPHFSRTERLVVNANAAHNWTGFAAMPEDRPFQYYNAAAYDQTLVDQVNSTASSANNRLDLGGANLVVPPGQNCWLLYNTTLLRWQLIGLANKSVTYPRLQDAGAVTVLCRAATSAGPLGEAQATANDVVFRRSGSGPLAFGAINLASSNAVSGLLALVNGGTGADLSATGGAGQYLKQAGAGATVTVGTIPASDIAAGAALTKTDDTNVTLTVGGTPASAMLKAISITVGWSGQLSAARGGFGVDVSAQSGVPLFAAGVPTFTGSTGTGNFMRTNAPTIIPAASATPSNNGDLVIQATSNTSLTFKLKGSDGTVRSGSIALS